MSETGDGERDEQGRHLSREAARYRRRLREANAQRDSYASSSTVCRAPRSSAWQRALALRSAPDIWSHGATADRMRGEDGDIDRQVVEGLVADLVKVRPGLKAVPIGTLRRSRRFRFGHPAKGTALHYTRFTVPEAARRIGHGPALHVETYAHVIDAVRGTRYENLDALLAALRGGFGETRNAL